jgi:hypothetical protein
VPLRTHHRRLHGSRRRPDRVEALDRDFLRFAHEWNRADPGERARYEYEYLLVVARRAGG